MLSTDNRLRSSKRTGIYVVEILVVISLSLLVTYARPPYPNGSHAESSPSPTPTISPEPLNSSPSKVHLIKPGKIDFQYRHRDMENEYNLIWWSPLFKGGAGVIDSDKNGRTEYAGGFIRPLLPLRAKNELILGAQMLRSNNENAWEFQGEYRFHFGLGVGGGFVRRTNRILNTDFGKVSYRNNAAKWHYIFEVQAQKAFGKTSLGGYGAIYDDRFMFTMGTDNEQWRTVIGYVAPQNKQPLRPAFEILYVNNNIGNSRGSKSFFVNGSIKYYGGFLTHESRLGRAMGPTGLEFGNPLSFLSIWNRRLDVWELGDKLNYRLEHITQPNGQVFRRYEFVAFPLQFDTKPKRCDRVFAGAFFASNLDKRMTGIQGGYFGKLWHLDIALKGEYSPTPRVTGISLGIIQRF
jgi:hypothetical protein